MIKYSTGKDKNMISAFNMYNAKNIAQRKRKVTVFLTLLTINVLFCMFSKLLATRKHRLQRLSE